MCAIIVDEVINTVEFEVCEAEVACEQFVVRVRRVLLVFDFDSFIEVSYDAVGEVSTGPCAQEHTDFTTSDSVSDEGRLRDGRNSEWHSVGCYVWAVIAVELTTAVTYALVLDDQPLGATAREALVVVKCVIAAESYCCVVYFDGSTEELDSVVVIGDDFYVVDGCAVTNTAQCQTVDFVCSSELCSTVADAHVGDNTGVVRCVRSTVLGAVVIRRDAFYLAFTGREVGRSVTANNHTAPLAACIVCH